MAKCEIPFYDRALVLLVFCSLTFFFLRDNNTNSELMQEPIVNLGSDEAIACALCEDVDDDAVANAILDLGNASAKDCFNAGLEDTKFHFNCNGDFECLEDPKNEDASVAVGADGDPLRFGANWQEEED